MYTYTYIHIHIYIYVHTHTHTLIYIYDFCLAKQGVPVSVPVRKLTICIHTRKRRTLGQAHGAICCLNRTYKGTHTDDTPGRG